MKMNWRKSERERKVKKIKSDISCQNDEATNGLTAGHTNHQNVHYDTLGIDGLSFLLSCISQNAKLRKSPRIRPVAVWSCAQCMTVGAIDVCPV